MGLKILCSGGTGLFTFQNPEEAVAGIGEVNRRYKFHCHAAQEIAEEYFDARRVLSCLLEQAMGPELEPATGSEKEHHAEPRIPCALSGEREARREDGEVSPRIQ